MQLTVEEAHVAPEVVTGKFLLPISYDMSVLIFTFYVFHLGSFHVNGIPVHVLFELRDTLSFISLTLNKSFSESTSMLDCPLEVKIADDRSVRASEVLQRLCPEDV